MMIGTLTLACVFFLSAIPLDSTFVPDDFTDLFESRECRLNTGDDRQECCVHYRLFVPRDLNPNERYPLLLWIHADNDGGDYHEYFRYLPLVLDDPKNIAKYRFFILVPQTPSKGFGWTQRLGSDATTSKTIDMLAATHDILQKTLREQPVDADRLYLMGVCSGGNACWELIARHPNVYAATVLLAPGGRDVGPRERLTNVPIWAYHNIGDGLPPEGTVEMVNAVKKAGGNAHVTLVPAEDHDCWTPAIRRHQCIQWMLEQRHDACVCWTPPGHRLWQWRHILPIPSLFAAVLCWACWSEKKRRRTKRQTNGPPETHLPDAANET